MNQNPQSNDLFTVDFHNAISASIGFITSRLPEITILMEGLINSGQTYRNATQ